MHSSQGFLILGMEQKQGEHSQGDETSHAERWENLEPLLTALYQVYYCWWQTSAVTTKICI